MSKEERRVPELRFKGFHDDWEQRELNDMYKVKMGHSPKSENYTSNPNDYILVQGNADLINGRVSPRVWTTQITSLVKAGSILISVRAPVGNVGKTAYNIVIGRGIASINGDEFIFQLLTKMHFNRYWKKFSTGSTFESINSRDIKEALIKFPTEEERNTIGVFLEKIDYDIALHQQKINTLKKIKQEYLKIIFPNKGQITPKLQFSNFNDKWEENQISNYMSERTERSANGELISVTIEDGVVRTNTLNRKNNTSEDKSNYKRVKKGDIPYNSMRMWQGASGLSEYDGILSPAYTVLVPRSNASGLFFSYLFKTKLMLYQFRKFSQGLTSDTWNLKYPLVKNIYVKTPNLNEQQLISEFFRDLDKIITMQQSKVDSLLNIKRLYLQKMFI